MSSAPTPSGSPQQLGVSPTQLRAILIGVVVFLLGAFAFNEWKKSQRDQSGTGERSGQRNSSTPRKGEEGYLQVDDLDMVLVAVSESALDELNSYSSSQNADGLKQLIRQGRVLNCRRGTRVTVIDPGFASTTVRILSGPHEGATGIVPNEFLRK